MIVASTLHGMTKTVLVFLPHTQRIMSWGVTIVCNWIFIYLCRYWPVQPIFAEPV